VKSDLSGSEPITRVPLNVRVVPVYPLGRRIRPMHTVPPRYSEAHGLLSWWHHRTPLVLGGCRQFALRNITTMTRFFAAKASSVVWSVVTSDFRRSPTPCVFRLGEPALPPQILTSPVACAVRLRGFHLSAAPLRPCWDAAFDRAYQDRSTARRLELTTSLPRMSSIGAIPTLSGRE